MGNPSLHLEVVARTLSAAPRKIHSRHGKIRLSLPFLDTPQASSLHQVRASNKSVDCWQWVKVTHSDHTSYKPKIPNHRAPVFQHNTFGFILVSSPNSPCDLFASPKPSPHSSPPHPSKLRHNAHKMNQETGPWGKVLYNNSVCECSNTAAPQASFYWSYTINAFYFLCA